jgi:uncharacterized alpha-E superfamily protein
MGRYAERCENIARLLRAALVRLADADPESHAALTSLAGLSAHLEILPVREPSGPDVTAARLSIPRASSDGEKPHETEMGRDLMAAAVDPSVSGGLVANVMRLHSCANQVRERMSTDNWHVFNRLPHRLPGKEASLGAALESLDEVMLACVSLAGFAMDDMTRDESWQFLPLGRRLERLANLARIVAHVLTLPEADREEALEWLLEAANSIVTFRARYRRTPELLPVIHLVVLDETNPHAVAFQLRDIAITLMRTSAELGANMSGEELGSLIGTLRQLPLGGFEPESGETVEAACKHLAGLLERAEQVAFTISDDLQRRFFTHVGTRSVA